MARIGRRLALVWVILVMVLYVPTNGLTSFVNRANPAVALRGLAALDWVQVGVMLRELPVALVGVALLGLSFWLVGLAALRLFTPPEGALARSVTALLLGQWVASLGLMGLALVGQFRPLPVALMLLALAGVGVAGGGVRPLLRDLPAAFRDLIPAENPWRTLFVLGGVAFVLSGLTAWAQMSNDGATAYFLTARITALTGDLRPVNEYVFHLSPHHTELQYAAGTLLFNHRAGRLVAWLYLMAAVLMAFPLGRVLGLDVRENAVFAFMVGSSTAILDLAGDGKIDLTGIAVGMAALYWLLLAVEKRSPRLLALTGLLLGVAVINKPTYIPFLAAMTLAALVWRYRAGVVRAALPVIAGGMVPVVLYMAVKWVVAGEPLAPAFYIDPPPRPTDITLNETWTSSPETVRTVRLLFPLVYTFIPTHFSLGTLSPLWLAFLPLSFSRRQLQRFPAVYGWVTAAAAVAFAAWLLLSFAVEELRYFYVVWVLLFAMTARAIVTTYQRKEFRPVITAVLVGLPLLLAGRSLLITAAMLDAAPDPVEVRCRSLLGCAANDLLNETTPEGTRIIQIHEFGHYLRPDLIACLPTMAEHQALTRAAFAGEFWQAAYDMGFTVLNIDDVVSLRNWHFIEPDLDAVPAGLDVTVLSAPTDFESGVYLIEAQPGTPPPQRTCQPTATGWAVQP